VRSALSISLGSIPNLRSSKVKLPLQKHDPGPFSPNGLYFWFSLRPNRTSFPHKKSVSSSGSPSRPSPLDSPCSLLLQCSCFLLRLLFSWPFPNFHPFIPNPEVLPMSSPDRFLRRSVPPLRGIEPLLFVFVSLHWLITSSTFSSAIGIDHLVGFLRWPPF